MEHASAIPISIAIARVRSEALDIQRRVADQESLNASTAETHESWAREQVALDERHADAFLYAEDELMEANAKKTTQYEDALERNEGERRAVEGYEAQYSEMEAQVQALRLQLEAFPVQEGEALRDLQEGRDRLDSIVRSIDEAKRLKAAERRVRSDQIDLYSRAMGFEYERDSDGCAVFKLTCVDDRDVAKEHCITFVRVPDEDNRARDTDAATATPCYAVHSITPALPSETFTTLAAAFDSHKSILETARATRKAFRAIYAAR